MRACVRGGRPTWGWAEVGSAAASGEGPTLVAVGDSEGQLYLLQFGTQVRARDAAAARRRCCLSFRGGCTAPVAAACRRPALNAAGEEVERGRGGHRARDTLRSLVIRRRRRRRRRRRQEPAAPKPTRMLPDPVRRTGFCAIL